MFKNKEMIWKYLLLLSLLWLWYFFSYSNAHYYTIEWNQSTSSRIQYYGYENLHYFTDYGTTNFELRHQVWTTQARYCSNYSYTPRTTSRYTTPFMTAYEDTGTLDDIQPWYFWFNSNFTNFAFQWFTNWTDCAYGGSDMRYARLLQKYYWSYDTWLTYFDLTYSTPRIFWSSWYSTTWKPSHLEIFDTAWTKLYVDWNWYVANLIATHIWSRFYGYKDWFSYSTNIWYLTTWYEVWFRRNDLNLYHVANIDFNNLDFTAYDWLYIDLDWRNKNWTNNTKQYLTITKDYSNLKKLKYVLQDCGLNSCSTSNAWYLTYLWTTDILPFNNVNSTIYMITTSAWDSYYKYVMWLFNTTNIWTHNWYWITPFYDVKLSGWNNFCYYNWIQNVCFGLTDWYDTTQVFDVLSGWTTTTNSWAQAPNFTYETIEMAVSGWALIWDIIAMGMNLNLNPTHCQDFNVNTAPPSTTQASVWNKHRYCCALWTWEKYDLSTHQYTWNYACLWLVSTWNSIDYIIWWWVIYTWTTWTTWTTNTEWSNVRLFQCDIKFKNSAWFAMSLTQLINQITWMPLYANTYIWDFDILPPIACFYWAFKYGRDTIAFKLSDFTWWMQRFWTWLSILTYTKATQNQKDLRMRLANIFLSAVPLTLAFRWLFK
jgi:hypothetical protein